MSGNIPSDDRRRAMRDEWRTAFAKNHQYEAWKYITYWWWPLDICIRRFSDVLTTDASAKFADISAFHAQTAMSNLAIVSMWHLQRAVGFAGEVLDISCRELLRSFSLVAPCVKAIRDTLLHFEDYEVGKGRLQKSQSFQENWVNAQLTTDSLGGCDCFFVYGIGPHKIEVFSAWRAAREMVDGVFVQLPDSETVNTHAVAKPGWDKLRCTLSHEAYGSEIAAETRHCDCLAKALARYPERAE